MSANLFDPSFLQQLERLTLLSRKAMRGQMQGERRSPKRGQSVEFSDFRPYVAGDDFRRIDWNAYARLERFFIKLFVEEEDLTIHFVIDASRSMAWGQPKKLEYAVRAAGALGYIALTGLDQVTATSVGGLQNGSQASVTWNGTIDHFPPHRGKSQAGAFFTFLQSQIAGDRHPADPARKLRAIAASARRGPLLLVSDLMHDGWMEGLRAIAGRGFEITVIHLLSPEELQPELNGEFKLLDSENEETVEITADFETLERYRQGLREWQAGLQRFCAARGMHYVPLSTATPLEELLFKWLRVQGVLR